MEYGAKVLITTHIVKLLLPKRVKREEGYILRRIA